MAPTSTTPPTNIVPGSPFGDALTALARQCQVVVEFGTAGGDRSTRCLVAGLPPTGRLWTVEADESRWRTATARWAADTRVVCLHGRLLEPLDYPPQKWNGPESVWHQLPESVDLCLFDGGGWETTEPEFERFYSRCRWVALDDTNHERDHKSWRLRRRILREGWKILHDEPNNRTGWMIAEVPTTSPASQP